MEDLKLNCESCGGNNWKVTLTGGMVFLKCSCTNGYTYMMPEFTRHGMVVVPSHYVDGNSIDRIEGEHIHI